MIAEQKTKRAYRRTAETKQIIFEKAISLMVEKGFQGTTVREICSEASVPVGTFYNCFKSKVDILKQIYDSGDAYMKSAVSMESEGKRPIDKLMVFAENYAKLNEDTGIEVMRVLFHPGNELFSQERLMQNFIQDVILEGQAVGEIHKDLDAGYTADCVFDILRGVCYNWCVSCGNFSLQERTRFHIRLFCNAIMQK